MGDDHVNKDLIGDGYTIRHGDGTQSHASSDVIGDGVTIRHADGSESHMTKDVLGDDHSIRHPDSSETRVINDVLGEAYTLIGEDGSRRRATPDVLGTGWTIRETRPPRRQQARRAPPAASNYAGSAEDSRFEGVRNLLLLIVLTFLASMAATLLIAGVTRQMTAAWPIGLWPFLWATSVAWLFIAGRSASRKRPG